MLILIDERGLAHKVYPDVPSESHLREDLRLLTAKDRQRLALPFPGQYYTAPRRNHFRLGAAFFWAGYPEQALVYLNEVIREQPDNGKAQLAVGYIHMEAGRKCRGARTPGARVQAAAKRSGCVDLSGPFGDGGEAASARR